MRKPKPLPFRSRSVQSLALFTLFSLFALPGCGSDELESPTAAKLRTISNLYLTYAIGKNGQGPESEEGFKKYLRGLTDDILVPAGVDRKEIDSLFISERDGQPFVVLYGLKITGISGKSGSVLAHEKTGKNGKRLVALSNTKVEHVDESGFQDLLSVKP
jgi:hypothetical protein